MFSKVCYGPARCKDDGIVCINISALLDTVRSTDVCSSPFTSASCLIQWFSTLYLDGKKMGCNIPRREKSPLLQLLVRAHWRRISLALTTKRRCRGRLPPSLPAPDPANSTILMLYNGQDERTLPEPMLWPSILLVTRIAWLDCASATYAMA